VDALMKDLVAPNHHLFTETELSTISATTAGKK